METVTKYPLSEAQYSVVKDKSVLIFGSKNNIGDFIFSGLNFRDSDVTEYLEDSSDLNDFKNKHYDVVVVHGFQYEGMSLDTNFINEVKKTNISCDVFLIDMLGEGYKLAFRIKNFRLDIFNQNEVKLLTPFYDYKGLEEKYPNIEFFKYELAGPLNLCSRFNHTFHHDHTHGVYGENAQQVVVGVRYSEKKRNKLFTCLNNNMVLHRDFMVHVLDKYGLLDYGYVSNRNGSDSYKHMLISESNGEEEYVYYSRNIKIDSGNLEERFKLQSYETDSYVSLVTETYYGILQFITEKSMKPFYALQLPLIFGCDGTVEILRKHGFDMFDDIIDHSYDDVGLSQFEVDDWIEETTEYNTLVKKKSEMIGEQLKKLSNLDIHQIYLDIKDRLLYNQNLVYKLTIEDNTLIEDYGRWIFGDNITFKKNDYIEKLYI